MRFSRSLLRASLFACILMFDVNALRANDALDFWREEYTRQQQSTPQGGRVEAPRPDPPLRFTIRPRRETVGDGRENARDERQPRQAGHGSERHYCVRTCDGFYFPLSGRGSLSNAEMCRALCPGAPTEVYRMGSGADSIEEAVSERGKAYTSLPAALAYRKSLDPGCACRGSGAVAMAVPITRDPTLARGDIVVTQKGVHVFTGGKFPHRDGDFVHYRSYRGLSREVLTMLALIDRPFRAAELKQTLDLRQERDATGVAKSAGRVANDAL